MSVNGRGSEDRVLEVLREMSSAQTEHGRALEALRNEFRTLNQSATFAAGVATLARHEVECATLRIDQTDVRLEQLEQRLSVVERKLSK